MGTAAGCTHCAHTASCKKSINIMRADVLYSFFCIFAE